MIWGIHYFITKLKTKIDVIPRGCFKLWDIPTPAVLHVPWILRPRYSLRQSWSQFGGHRIVRLAFNWDRDMMKWRLFGCVRPADRPPLVNVSLRVGHAICNAERISKGELWWPEADLPFRQALIYHVHGTRDKPRLDKKNNWILIALSGSKPRQRLLPAVSPACCFFCRRHEPWIWRSAHLVYRLPRGVGLRTWLSGLPPVDCTAPGYAGPKLVGLWPGVCDAGPPAHQLWATTSC